MWTVVVGGIAVWLAVLLIAMAMGKRSAKPWPGDAKFAPKPPPAVIRVASAGIVGTVVKVERVSEKTVNVHIKLSDGTTRVVPILSPEVNDIRPGQWAAVRKVHPND